MARDATRVHVAASDVGAYAVAVDLADRAALRRAADAAAGLAGEPDILVNAAAINPRPPLGELSEKQWDETLETNLTAPFLLGQRYGPGMAERGWGRIINLASQQAIRAFGNSGAYGVSKGGIVSLTRSQAEAWSPRGVCCNAVAPGFVRTPMTEPVFAVGGAADALAARTMIGRNGTPDDFAGIAVFLASDASAYVTGQLICVDGGFSAR
jgi:NAD(P)-dependent dehydrogenase (short-subunit alcohol dehydrogenase family)